MTGVVVTFGGKKGDVWWKKGDVSFPVDFPLIRLISLNLILI